MVEESASTAAKTPRRRSLAWPPFEDQLTAVLGALEEDQFLVIAVKRTNRAGLVLVERGISPRQAIGRVRAARPHAIETRAQEHYVLNARPAAP